MSPANPVKYAALIADCCKESPCAKNPAAIPANTSPVPPFVNPAFPVLLR